MTSEETPTAVRPVHADDALHFPTLDGVRFLAYFAVFLSHAVPALKLPTWAPGWLVQTRELFTSGGFGVDLFLVLSAFLITSLLLHEQAKKGRITIHLFYIRRMLRIWPLYLTFLVAMLVASSLWAGNIGLRHIADGYWISFALLVGNWYTGLHGYPASNIAPLWSVSLEEQFYLAWPVVLVVFRRHLVKVCAALFSVSVVARLAVVSLGLAHPAMWTFTVTRLDPILLGALLAIGYRNGVLPSLGRATQWTLIVFGFAAWPLAYWLFGSGTDLIAATVSLPLAALCSAGILLAAVKGDGAVRRFLTTRWIVRMGSLSYGTYVFHSLMIQIARRLLAGQSAWVYDIVLVPLSFVLTWLLAELSYRFLEEPFLRMRKRFRPVGAAPSPAPAPAPPAPSAEVAP